MGGSINYAYGNGPGMPATVSAPPADPWAKYGAPETPAAPPADDPWAKYGAPENPASLAYGQGSEAMNGLTLGASDWLRGLVNSGTSWLGGNGFNYRQDQEDVANARRAYENAHPVESTVANAAGGLAGGFVPGGAVARLGEGANLAGRVGIGAATGSGMGAAQGFFNNPESPGAGAAQGATVGGAIGGALPTAGALMGPFSSARRDALQTLRAAGVEPTLGAYGGVPAVAESFVSHIPIIGGSINAGRAAAKGQLATTLENNAENFQRDTINYALEPIGESLNPKTEIGNDAVAEAQQKVSGAYHAAIPNVGGAVDAQLQKDISDAIANARLRLPKEQADQFENFVNNSIDRRVAPAQNPTSLGQALGTLSGQDLKDADTELGKEAANYLSGNTSPNDRTLGNAYRDLQGSLRGWIARVSPQNAQDLQNANDAYSRMLRINNAAGRNINGEFTPQNLAAASKLYSSTPQYAAGGALMQGQAQDAYNANQALINAGRTLPGPNASGGHGGTVAGAGSMGIGVPLLLNHFLEHGLEHWPYFAGLGAAGVPLAGAYSNAGRAAINGLNSLAFVPGGAGYASGLLPPPAPQER